MLGVFTATLAAGGSPWIVSLFAFSGPGRKAKVIMFLLSPPFTPKIRGVFIVPFARGKKLDGVSSTSLQGVSPGPLGNPLFFPLENFGLPLADYCLSLGSLVYACALTL